MKDISSKSVPNIYLIGMMGSGKSVTGKKLAELMEMDFIDLDEALEKEESRSIAEIFRAEGEEFFREQETKVLNRVSSLRSNVIATGGGVILQEENISIMKDAGIMVYLETSLQQVWERVKGKKGRPLIEGPDPRKKLDEIFKSRKSTYEEICDFSVLTDGRSPADVAKIIEMKIAGKS